MTIEEMTEEQKEIYTQIINVLRSEQKAVNPSVVTQKLKWNKDKIKDICTMFGKENFSGLLAKMPRIVTTKNGDIPYVQYYVTDSEMYLPKFSMNQPNIRQRFVKLFSLLNSGLYEKEEAVRLALLSAVAGESIFFLGPPGTAKSMISNRIHKAFIDETKYYEYLMNEFSTPDEIFGSIKLKGLDEGIYEKNTSGYLPEAHIAFLDEIWKSGPAILNTLLTIINEKKFRNGNTIEKVPLQILLAASNELPKEKAGLEALYDRFIIRTLVNPVSFENKEGFFKLCEKTNTELTISNKLKSYLLSVNEILEWQEDINKVIINNQIKEVIMEIRRELERKNGEKDREKKDFFYVSDRRWKKIIHLLKTSAFLCDRSYVDLMDCQLITYCIWSTSKQRIEVQTVVKDIVQQHGLECTTAIDDIEQEIEKFEKYIDHIYYQLVPSHDEAVKFKMNDGHLAYKLIKPKNIGPSYSSVNASYISVQNVHKYDCDRIGAYYNSDKNLHNDKKYSISENNYSITGDTIVWKDNSTGTEYSSKIETKKIEEKLKKIPDLFKKKDILQASASKTDKEKYSPILSSINEQLASLDSFRKKIEQPYNDNLFADSSFKKIITSKIEEEKKKLEDARIELEKQKSRYDA